MNNRPTFYTKDNQEIRAAGIIFFVYVNGTKKWLFRKSNNYYSDIGGKTEQIDKNPIDTAIRETCEETNNSIFSSDHDVETCRNILSQKFKDQKPVSSVYIKKSKYILYMVRIEKKYHDSPISRFGEKEDETGEKHSFHWFESIDFESLHPRLRSISKFFNNNIDKKNNENLNNQNNNEKLGVYRNDEHSNLDKSKQKVNNNFNNFLDINELLSLMFGFDSEQILCGKMSLLKLKSGLYDINNLYSKNKKAFHDVDKSYDLIDIEKFIEKV
jgi:hypothetical protein